MPYPHAHGCFDRGQRRESQRRLCGTHTAPLAPLPLTPSATRLHLCRALATAAPHLFLPRSTDCNASLISTALYRLHRCTCCYHALATATPTALRAASAHGHAPFVRWLLDAGSYSHRAPPTAASHSSVSRRCNASPASAVAMPHPLLLRSAHSNASPLNMLCARCAQRRRTGTRPLCGGSSTRARGRARRRAQGAPRCTAPPPRGATPWCGCCWRRARRRTPATAQVCNFSLIS
jgi:hypothetical protein